MANTEGKSMDASEPTAEQTTGKVEETNTLVDDNISAAAKDEQALTASTPNTKPDPAATPSHMTPLRDDQVLKGKWLLDFEASFHVVKDLKWLDEADRAKGRGNIVLAFCNEDNEGQVTHVELENVVYVATSPYNRLSVKCLTEEDEYELSYEPGDDKRPVACLAAPDAEEVLGKGKIVREAASFGFKVQKVVDGKPEEEDDGDRVSRAFMTGSIWR